MINPLTQNLTPIPSDQSIRDVLAILNAISDADAHRTFLAAVVARSEAQANAALDSANAAMAAASNSQMECDRQRAEVEAQRVAQDSSLESRRAVLEAEYAAKMAHALDTLTEASQLAALAQNSKAKYEQLTADLRERVASAATVGA